MRGGDRLVVLLGLRSRMGVDSKKWKQIVFSVMRDDEVMKNEDEK